MIFQKNSLINISNKILNDINVINDISDFRGISHINDMNNISDIVINVSYLSDKIISAIGDGSRFGVKIFYSIEKPEPFAVLDKVPFKSSISLLFFPATALESPSYFSVFCNAVG